MGGHRKELGSSGPRGYKTLFSGCVGAGAGELFQETLLDFKYPAEAGRNSEVKLLWALNAVYLEVGSLKFLLGMDRIRKELFGILL